MAAFSSRGPGGLVPQARRHRARRADPGRAHADAGRDRRRARPASYYQAIAGTSMSSPHVAGAGPAVRAVHPDWTPGQIKSALMTTAMTDGGEGGRGHPGRPVRHRRRSHRPRRRRTPGLTFDETAARFFALRRRPGHGGRPQPAVGQRPGDAGSAHHRRARRRPRPVHGRRPTRRRRTGRAARSRCRPAGSPLRGRARSGTLHDHRSRSGADRRPAVRRDPARPRSRRRPRLHLPVAFVRTQGDVSPRPGLRAAASVRGRPATTCTVTATNNTFDDATVDLTSTTSRRQARGHRGDRGDRGRTRQCGSPTSSLHRSASRRAVGRTRAQPWRATCRSELFGITPTPIGDEEIVNYTVPAFVYNGQYLHPIGVDSNGYLVVGGGTAEDNNAAPCRPVPDPARPNNVLAPFWTDLDGTGAPGIRGRYADRRRQHLDRRRVAGERLRHDRPAGFQVWIGVNGVQDISFAYDPGNLPSPPRSAVPGRRRERHRRGDMPAVLRRRTWSSPAPTRRPAACGVHVHGPGAWPAGAGVTTEMGTPAVAGVTVVRSAVQVTRR